MPLLMLLAHTVASARAAAALSSSLPLLNAAHGLACACEWVCVFERELVCLSAAPTLERIP
jgi:hypothetical protein